MKSARETALHILYQIQFEQAYSNLALKNGLHSCGLSKTDKGFVTGLVYGVISRRLTLEHAISMYSSVKLKKLSKYVLLILEMGLYQLLYMDKIPTSAAVNESVKLANRYAGRSSGFVNGVLRAFVRDGMPITLPIEPGARLSVKHSFPEAVCQRWIQSFGYEFTDSLMEALNQPPKTTVRVNRLKTDREKLAVLMAPEAAECRDHPFYLWAMEISGVDIAGSKLFQEGYFTVQDTAAMLASAVLDPKPGQTVLDLCAAPGGKTTHLAELMENKGCITAFDVHPHKVKLIEYNARRLGLDIIQAQCADAGVFQPELGRSADKVLADVPCSGWGIVRRKPDIKYNRMETGGLLELQKAILENAAGYLKPGGELVYSTCTIEDEENNGVTQAFLIRHPEFEPVDISGHFPQTLKKETTRRGYISLYPNIDGTDGFYICKLRKKIE